MKAIPFEKLLEVPIDDMKMKCNSFIQKKLGLNVYRVELLIYSPTESIARDYYVHRNYFELKDLFDKYTRKYPDEKFHEFPSRLTFTKNQEETRMKYFHIFLNKVLEGAKDENKAEDKLNLLYNFLFEHKDTINIKLTKEMIKETFNKDVADSDIVDIEKETEVEKEETKEKQEKQEKQDQSSNIDINNSSALSFSKDNPNNFLEILNNENKLSSIDKYVTPNPDFNKDNPFNNISVFSPNDINENNKSSEKESNFNFLKRTTLNYVNTKFGLFKKKDVKEAKENKEPKAIKKAVSTKRVSKYLDENNIWENLLVKTTLKDFCLHKMKIKEKCLFLSYDEKLKHKKEIHHEEKELDRKISGDLDKNKDFDFYLVIPLYKINIEIYRIIYPLLLSEDKTLITVPEYYKKVRISSSEIYDLDNYAPDSTLNEINSEIEIKLYHDYDRFQTFIRFRKDWKISDITNCLSKILESSFTNKPKSQFIEDVYESNMDSFGNIMIDLVEFSAPYFKGKVKIKINYEPYTFYSKAVISKASFCFDQKFIIPKHNRFKYLKIYIYKTKEGGLIRKKDEDKLISVYEIPLPKLINVYHLNKDPIEFNLKPTKEKAKKKKMKYTEMVLKLKCIDYSSLLAILVKNTNKRVLDSYPLRNKDGDSEEPYTITILLKRIKRVLYMFKNIYGFYEMLKFFKYPVVSILFWIVLLFYTLVCDPRFWMTHLVVFILSILFFYSSIFQNYIFPKLKPILFYVRNKYDTPSLLAATESQKNKEEVAQNDYLTKKKGFFIPSIKDIKEYKHTYIDLLFRLSRITSFCEKFKNLFLWTDPLLSFYMMVLLILFVLITWKIEIRFLICFSVSKKLFFGIFYYKNKLINNLEIARIVTSDAFEIWKRDKLAKEKDDKKDKKEKKIIKIMEKKSLDDEKLKTILKNKLYEHSNIILSDKFFEKMETLGDVIEELGKIQDILKIKRLSYLFQLTKNNPKIFPKEIEPEDIFAYFIQNIKSDYYLAQNGFIKTDYFKNDNIIEEEMEPKKNINKSVSGSIPDDIDNKLSEIK